MSHRAENKSIDVFFRVEFDFRIRFCVAPRKSTKNDEKLIGGVGTWAWGGLHKVFLKKLRFSVFLKKKLKTLKARFF